MGQAGLRVPGKMYLCLVRCLTSGAIQTVHKRSERHLHDTLIKYMESYKVLEVLIQLRKLKRLKREIKGFTTRSDAAADVGSMDLNNYT